MATAQSYEMNIQSPELPNPNMTDSEFGSGKSVWAKIGRFFGGVDSEQQYQNSLTQNNREYEQALLKEQRDYEEYVRNREYEREDTKYQRMINDIKAAGLNPWLALQGGISGTSAQGQPVTSSTVGKGSSAKAQEDKSSNVISSFLIAAAKLISTL